MGAPTVGSAPGEERRCANSTGAGAELEGQGSNGVAADDLALRASAMPPASLGVTVGETRVFQAWYRDRSSPCAGGFNATNAYEVVFAP